MDYKKIKTDTFAVTRNLNDFDKETENIYESLIILSKRANQIAVELKEELNEKIVEFTDTNDLSDEIFENKEQIELARYYEMLPKPTLLSVQEFMDNQIYFRLPEDNSKREVVAE